MADVFEDLLAALDEDSSKVPLQHGDLQTHHQGLHLPQAGLQDNVSFNSMQPTNGVDLLAQGPSQQNITGIGSLTSHSHLTNQTIQDAFSQQAPVESASSLAMQGGSSLGSLFLSTVDEMLSSEKTTGVEFAPPTTKAPPPKPSRAKPKKPFQRKIEKTTPMVSNEAVNTQIGSNMQQQMQGIGQTTTYKQPPATVQHYRGVQTNNNFNTPSRPPSNSATVPDSHYMAAAAPSPEAYSRTIYRQTGTQLARPQSNASSDSNMYMTNMPQPSPSGSMDSQYGPRTPMSNNPLTPQSVQQPPTPQSNQSLSSQGNLAGPATPVNQPQHTTTIMGDTGFVGGLGLGVSSPPPPIIPDDQSHLQYLNTPSGQRDNSRSSSELNLLDDLPTPIKQQFGLEGDGSVSSNMQPTNWLNQFTNVPTQYSNLTNQGDNLLQTTNVNSGMTSNMQQTAFQQNQGNARPIYSSFPNSSMSISSGVGQQNSYVLSIPAQSECLTQTQSQLLESLSGWGKSKSVSKAPATTLSNSQDLELMGQLDPTIVHGAPGMFAGNQGSSGNIPSISNKSNTVLDMLSTAQSGIKQHMSNTYEAISPVSDFASSPVGKETTADQRHRNNQNAYSIDRQGYAFTSNMATSQNQMPVGLQEIDKPKVGPLARRRSASAERKTTTTLPKQPPPKEKETPTDFNFDDDFGFDHEPTIKLPSQRVGGPIDAAKKVAPTPEPVNPVLKMHREDYADQSVYDSVQELAALQQKQKSLMKALASRNVNTSPQKPSWGRVANTTTMAVTSTTSQVQPVASQQRTVKQPPRKPQKPHNVMITQSVSQPPKGQTAKAQKPQPSSAMTTAGDIFASFGMVSTAASSLQHQSYTSVTQLPGGLSRQNFELGHSTTLASFTTDNTNFLPGQGPKSSVESRSTATGNRQNFSSAPSTASSFSNESLNQNFGMTPSTTLFSSESSNYRTDTGLKTNTATTTPPIRQNFGSTQSTVSSLPGENVTFLTDASLKTSSTYSTGVHNQNLASAQSTFSSFPSENIFSSDVGLITNKAQMAPSSLNRQSYGSAQTSGSTFTSETVKLATKPEVKTTKVAAASLIGRSNFDSPQSKVSSFPNENLKLAAASGSPAYQKPSENRQNVATVQSTTMTAFPSDSFDFSSSGRLSGNTSYSVTGGPSQNFSINQTRSISDNRSKTVSPKITMTASIPTASSNYYNTTLPYATTGFGGSSFTNTRTSVSTGNHPQPSSAVSSHKPITTGIGSGQNADTFFQPSSQKFPTIHEKQSAMMSQAPSTSGNFDIYGARAQPMYQQVPDAYTRTAAPKPFAEQQSTSVISAPVFSGPTQSSAASKPTFPREKQRLSSEGTKNPQSARGRKASSEKSKKNLPSSAASQLTQAARKHDKIVASPELLSNFEMFINQAASNASKSKIKPKKEKPATIGPPTEPPVSKTSTAVPSVMQSEPSTYLPQPSVTTSSVENFFAKSQTTNISSTKPAPSAPQPTTKPTSNPFLAEIFPETASSNIEHQRSKIDYAQPSHTKQTEQKSVQPPMYKQPPEGNLPSNVRKERFSKESYPAFPKESSESVKKTSNKAPSQSPMESSHHKALPQSLSAANTPQLPTSFTTVYSSAPHSIMYSTSSIQSHSTRTTSPVSQPSTSSTTTTTSSKRYSSANLTPPSSIITSRSHPSGYNGSSVQNVYPRYTSGSHFPENQSKEQRAIAGFASLASQPFPTGMFPPIGGHMIPDPAAVNQSLEFLRMAHKHMGGMGLTPSQSTEMFLGSLNPALSGSLPSYQQAVTSTQAQSVVTTQPPVSSSVSLSSKSSTEANPTWLFNKAPSASQSQLPSFSEFLTKDAPTAVKEPVVSIPPTSASKPFEPPVSSSSVPEQNVTRTSTAAVLAPIVSTETKQTPDKHDVTSATPSGNSILRDKTYHGPKKRHILQKYSQQNQTPTPIVASAPAKSNTQSVRSDKSSPVQSAPSHDTPLDFRTSVAGKGSSQGKAKNAKTNKPAAVPQQKETVSNNATTAQSVPKDNSSTSGAKDGKSGSIFSLFDSLLQEASQSAADSLKNVQSKKQDKTASPAAALPASTKAPVVTLAPTATTQSTIKSISNKVNNSKATSRSPATFPFKRRHVHHKTSDVQSGSNAASPVRFTDSSKSPSVVASTQSETKPTQTATVSTQPPGVSTAEASKSTESAPVNQAKPLGIKVRITAFRSAAGDVIHHASMVGDIPPPLADDAVDSDRSSRSKKKHKKHKKRRKRRRRTSSSESEASIAPAIKASPSHERKIGLPQPGLPSADERDAIFPSRPAVVASSNDSDVGSVSSATSKRRKKSAKSLQPSAKRIRTDSAGLDSDFEPVKKRGRPPKSANPMRYKPKAATTQAVPVSDPVASAQMSFNRTPGKTPMYMHAGSKQTVTSVGGVHAVPTIQLVPRTAAKTTAKPTSLTMVSPNQSAAKVLSVKLSVAPTKTVQAQIMTKTTLGGVRYILQTTSPGSAVSGAPRVIIPKLASPPFSVGKATVFTVSSTGTRVSIASAAQVPQTSQPSGMVSPNRPIVVKRLPISLLPKSTTSPIMVASTTLTVSKPTKSILGDTMPTSAVSASIAKVVVPPTSGIVSKSVTSKAQFKSVLAPILTEALKSGAKSKGSTESLFQTAFSKLISSPNPLAKYVPPPLPQRLAPTGPLPDPHRCFECGDTFLLQSSLVHHYERRSIFVKVRCVQCKKMLVFFNKCEILRHAREHSDRGDVMQFNGANLTPIPLTLCKPRTKDFFLRAAEERRKSCDGAKSSTMVCTECQFVADKQAVMDEHFQRRSAEWSSCDICRLHLHNNCAFSAHMRMHRHVAPHTCPECGQTFDGTAMDFNLHLRMQCFHLSRVSCFKCKLCNVTFNTDDQLRNHLRQNHVQLFYKCRECPMAFKTTQNIANHQRTAHNLTPEPTNTLKTIYKCPLCDTVFTDSSHSQQLFVLHKHFDTHINLNRITAYKCYLCLKLFEQKSLLSDHLQKEHDVNSLQEGAAAVASANTDDPTVCRTGEKRRSSEGKKTKPGKKSKYDIEKSADEPKLDVRSAVDRRSFSDNGDSDDSLSSGDVTGKLRKPFKIRMKGKPGSEYTPSKLPADQSDFVWDEGKRKYPCRECNKVFLSSHSRASHVRSIHRGIRASYCCPHCPVGNVKFAKRITLVKHLTRIHKIEYPQKEDIKIIRTHVPPLSSTPPKISSTKKSPVPAQKTPEFEERRFPRKKITTRNPIQARARRLAAASARHQAARGVVGGETYESDESYGEVDERSIEEGWNVPDEMDAEVSDNEAEIDVSSLRLPAVYICVKCDFQHEDRIVFQDHIVEHSSQTMDLATNGTAAALTMVQCTECGLSFASTASLDKHMHIKHKIRHRKLLERYDARLRAERSSSGQRSVGDVDDLPSSGASVPKLHRCKVCFRKFDTDAELRTHMRTHGLAFVKSKAS